MKDIIHFIRESLGMSQGEMADVLGVSFATVNRWENGYNVPNKMAQIRLYGLCKEHNIDLEAAIRAKIESAAPKETPTKKVLYHGSRSGINGSIAPTSRSRCDFGRGFYMGTDPFQPLTLVCDYDKSKFYALSIDLAGLQVLRINPGLEWAMIVAYNRGKMETIRGTAMYERYAGICSGYDVIIGNIADDRMFYVLDNFFLGNITDKALVMSLSALQLGEQYVALTEKACSRIEIEAEIGVSHLEREFLSDTGDANRVRGVNLANEVCKDYRREGVFFDEMLQIAPD